MTAVTSAVPKALDGSWLQLDSAANAGSGTGPYEPDDSGPPAPQVPEPDTGLPLEVPDVAPDATGWLHEPPHWRWNWPTFTQGQWTKGPVVRPVDGDPGEPDPYEARNTLGFGYDGRTNQYLNLNEYAGFDAHSQQTDTKGWRINSPTGRSAMRRRIGDASRGFAYLWNPAAERPTPRKLARRATPGNSPAGTPGVPDSSSLPDYGGITIGGNTAYETPAPPAVTQAQPEAPANDWTWGGF